jgi:hypothetical protein
MEVEAGLPHIDATSEDVTAAPERCWDALVAVVGEQMADTPARVVAAVLGCADRRARGPREVPGSALGGFHVVDAERPRRWRLEGRHRFSVYGLEFRIEEPAPGRSRLCAETRAAFPGRSGSLYRALVIGSGDHRVAVRRMLRSIKRRAETDPTPAGSRSGTGGA